MTDYKDIKKIDFANISDSGTEGTKVAVGTTGERGSTAGQIRFNSTTALAEYYTGTEFKSIDTPPLLRSVDVTNVATDLGGSQTFVVEGENFRTGVTLNFRDVDGSLITPDTTTRNSSTQITAIKTRSSFSNAKEPYDIIVTNISGLSSSLENQINVDNSPVWQTASGSLATINDNDTGTHATVSATDSDGDTVVYSVQSGSLPEGLSLNTSTGVISGDPTDVSSVTTSNFTLRATANGVTADRSFSITVNPTVAISYLLVAGGGGGGSNVNGFWESGTGGGAGGLLTGSTDLIIGTTYNFVVGAGGTGQSGTSNGNDGGNTTGLSLTAIGGGGGTVAAGRNGGSGSGGVGGTAGGAGTAGQGNNGGNSTSHQQHSAGAGGGGAGAVGGSGGYQSPGNGGAGLSNSITGSSITYAGGGGGSGAYTGGTSGGSGGSGGGGSGNNNGTAGYGTDGLGGGGGGSHNGNRSGDGGNGVVIISVPTAKYSSTTTGSPTVTTSGSNTIIKFTSNGSYTA